MNEFYRQYTCLHGTSASPKRFILPFTKEAFNRQIVHFSLVFGVLISLRIILYLSALLVNFHAWQGKSMYKAGSFMVNPILAENTIKLIDAPFAEKCVSSVSL